MTADNERPCGCTTYERCPTCWPLLFVRGARVAQSTCCEPVVVFRNGNGKRVSTTITLNEYQRANLLWLLCDVIGYDRTKGIVPELNTGDWVGEIANALRVHETEPQYE